MSISSEMATAAGHRITRRVILALGLGAIAAAPARATGNWRLIMVEEAGCIYCARWHAEVGPGYASSPEGRFAPLQQVRIGSAEVAGIQGLRYTPTFVLADGGREVGRITGYPGADFFWGLLDEMLGRTPYKGQQSAPEDIKT